MAATLAGFWSYKVDNSDFVPGLKSFEGSPIISCFSNGSHTEELLHIQQSSMGDVERVALSLISLNGQKNDRVSIYQLGSANYSNSESVGIVLGADSKFKHLAILRLGPRSQQYSVEVMRLDRTGDEIKTEIEIMTPEGLFVKCVRYLSRYRPRGVEIPELINFKMASNTQGWIDRDLRSFKIFETISISILKFAKIGKSSSKSLVTQDEKSLMAKIEAGNPEAIGTVIYIIQVVNSSEKWLVGHRYNDFESLRRYLAIELPQLGTASKKPTPSPPEFPRKKMSALLGNEGLEQRRQCLEAYLSFFIDYKAFFSRNAGDSLLSFLEVPENLFRLREAKKRMEEERQARLQQCRAPAGGDSSPLVLAPPSPGGDGSLGQKEPLRPTPARRRSTLSVISSVIFGTSETDMDAEPGGIHGLAGSATQFTASERDNDNGDDNSIPFGVTIVDDEPKGTPRQGVQVEGNNKASSASSASTRTPLAKRRSTLTVLASSVFGGGAGEEEEVVGLSRDDSHIREISIGHSGGGSGALNAGGVADGESKASSSSTGASTLAARVSPAPMSTSSSASGGGGGGGGAIFAKAALVAAATGGEDTEEKIILSPYQQGLRELLRDGIVVIKHEDEGPPKKRFLRVNKSVTRLYWSEPLDGKPKASTARTLEPGEELDPELPPKMYQSVAIANIRTVRQGTDEDPAAQQQSGGIFRRKSVTSAQLLGSATLRRTCKSEDLILCLCLVLLEKTIDIQCLSKEHFFVLYPNLEGLCRDMEEQRQQQRDDEKQ